LAGLSLKPVDCELLKLHGVPVLRVEIASSNDAILKATALISIALIIKSGY